MHESLQRYVLGMNNILVIGVILMLAVRLPARGAIICR